VEYSGQRFLNYYSSNFLKTRVALTPPKPKELERAIFTCAFLAILGTASRYIRWLSRHAFVTSIVAAVLLISIGILMLTGYLDYLGGLMPGGY